MQHTLRDEYDEGGPALGNWHLEHDIAAHYEYNSQVARCIAMMAYIVPTKHQLSVIYPALHPLQVLHVHSPLHRHTLHALGGWRPTIPHIPRAEGVLQV